MDPFAWAEAKMCWRFFGASVRSLSLFLRPSSCASPAIFLAGLHFGCLLYSTAQLPVSASNAWVCEAQKLTLVIHMIIAVPLAGCSSGTKKYSCVKCFGPSGRGRVVILVNCIRTRRNLTPVPTVPTYESDCGPVGVIWESSVDRQAVDGRTDQLFWGGCPQEFKIM